MTEPRRLTRFERGDLVFDVVDSGPIDGDTVVLLHGFPQTSASWDAVRALLNERGYRTVAPDQRGYSPGARPAAPQDYRMSELVRDTIALIDALDVPDVHLVGHDWGAAVAWATAIGAPTRVRTLTVLSVPHPAAFLRSMVRSAQLLRSSYMFLFQVPRLPEWLFRLPGAAVRVLRSSGLSARAAQRDAALLLDPNAATAALNWYRAMSPIRRPRRSRKPDQNRHSRDSRNGGKPSSRVTVPTAYLWSDKDIALGRKGAELTSRYVTGPYEFRVLPGVSHWIPDEAPEIVAEVVDQQAAAHPPAAS